MGLSIEEAGALKCGVHMMLSVSCVLVWEY